MPYRFAVRPRMPVRASAKIPALTDLNREGCLWEVRWNFELFGALVVTSVPVRYFGGSRSSSTELLSLMRLAHWILDAHVRPLCLPCARGAGPITC